MHLGKNSFVLSVELFLVFSSLGARAQRPGNQARLILQALDTNHDEKLSASEIQAAPKSLLTLDRDGDGQLIASELQPRPENAGATADELVKQLISFDKNSDGVLTPDELPSRMQNLFQRGDTNHDGKLSPDEIRALAARQGMPAGLSSHNVNAMMRLDPLLNALDSDHDGTISAAEIAAASQSLLTLDKNGDGEITADEMRVQQQSPQERVDHMLSEWDTDKDGKISKAEAPDRMQQQFESIDTNHDGVLDKDELLTYFISMGNGNQGSGSRPAGSTNSTNAPKGDH